ncbi:hypothetical protein [Methylosinus sporium]|uniref:Uncharacterized protein n=1 Tax=Methylosinus sporium TaxID=428 RepID=A0A2U1SSP6_METSR|nr:hypothetical protein [Methylosinus sporium]PWB94648.1 hypothetical protein C5689_06185 [Methylosinus sporium]
MPRAVDFPQSSRADYFLALTDAGIGLQGPRKVSAANVAAQLAVGAGRVFATWAAAATYAPTKAGERIEVHGDPGTHTDPVVGGTVPNSGVFSGSLAPIGWRWIDDSTLAHLDTQLAAETANRIAGDTAEATARAAADTAEAAARAAADTAEANTRGAADANLQSQISALGGALIADGSWNASTNSPTLASGTGTNGHYRIVSTAGSTALDGESSWAVGDWALFSGGAWKKITGQVVPLEPQITLAQLPSTHVPASITRIVVTGHTSYGDPGWGAVFRRGASGRPLSTQDADGAWWEYVPSDGAIGAGIYGMVMDGAWSVDYSTGVMTMTGTDNAPMLQAAVDDALRFGFRRVNMPVGKARYYDTIHLGYGTSIASIELTSYHMMRPGYVGQGVGAVMIFANSDRPAINVQAGREFMIHGFAIIGLNYGYIERYIFGPEGGRLYNYSADPADWLDPAWTPSGDNPGGLQRHSPLCAIAIDAYKGAQPADHYPTVTYPDWTGIGTTQYGKGGSSDGRIFDLDIHGFPVGIIDSPNGDGNGDFIKITDIVFSRNIVNIAICNTQARNNEIRNLNCVFYHTLLDNVSFGVGAGTIDGPLENIAGGQCYQAFKLNIAQAGPITMSNWYAEGSVRIGEIVGASVLSPEVILDNWNYQCDASEHRWIPPALIHNGTGKYAPTVRLRNPGIVATERLTSLTTGGECIVEGGYIIGAIDLPASHQTAAMRQAVNYAAGAFVGLPRTPLDFGHAIARNKMGRTWVNPDFSHSVTRDGPDALFDTVEFGGVVKQLSQWNTGFIDNQGKQWRFGRAVPHMQFEMSNASVVVVAHSFTNDVLTFNYANALQNNAAVAFSIGDIIMHQNTGTLFVIETIGAADSGHANSYPITARQTNNMRVDSSGEFATQLIADLALPGNMFWFKTGIWIPKWVYYGDFTAASASVANVHLGNGSGAELASHLPSSALPLKMISYELPDAALSWPLSANNAIDTVTAGSPGSLTLTGQAARTGRFPIHPLPLIPA